MCAKERARDRKKYGEGANNAGQNQSGMTLHPLPIHISSFVEVWSFVADGGLASDPPCGNAFPSRPRERGFFVPCLSLASKWAGGLKSVSEPAPDAARDVMVCPSEQQKGPPKRACEYEACFPGLGFAAKLFDFSTNLFDLSTNLSDLKAHVSNIALGSELASFGVVRLVPGV